MAASPGSKNPEGPAFTVAPETFGAFVRSL
ncbi:DUF397 domain-containing protein [Streptomyces sp. NPDC051704]